jgi:amino acid adenylation domain-containing protein
VTDVESPELYPLTSLQKSMALASLRAPRSGVYILQDVCELNQALDAEHLESAWRQVAQRHAALRTSIILAEEKFLQRVHPNPAIPWLRLDWSDIDPGQGRKNLAEYLRQDCERGFTFDEGVPIRFTLIRHSECSHTLIWTVHHVLLDGRSLAIVWQEWFGIYEALRRGEEPQLGHPKDFRHHVDWVQQQDLTLADQFWKAYFSGISQTTDYVIDRVGPARAPRADGAGKERVELSAELTGEIESFARRYDITINTMLQGAWALLLARYSDRSDIVFGATRAGRQSSIEDTAGMVGVLINTLPVRIAVTSDAPLIGWLKQIRAQWIAMRKFEHTPLEKVWEWSGLPPGMPPFDNLLVYEHEPLAESMRKLGGDWERRSISRMQRTDSPLTLAAYGRPLLTLELIYNQGVFGRECVRGMTRHLSRLLESFVAHPDRPLAEIKMLTEHEERWLIDDLNQTQTPYPRDVCVHQLFELQVARMPTQAAFDSPGGTVSYRELNQRANRLARFLREKGAAPEDLIAVCMDRSPDAVIAVLGIVKAGAASLPLDPRLPEARLIQMLEDAHPRLVLTDDTSFSKLSSYRSTVLNLAWLEGEIACYSEEALTSIATPDNAAYAIYTSGSTGMPKAVVITHRSLVSYVLAAARIYGISDSDRRLQFGWMGSDFFVAEVFNQLCTGATLVFCLNRQGNSVTEFLQLLDQQRITITGMPSSWWHQWVASFSQSRFTRPNSLRAVITGMEQVSPAALQAWKREVGTSIRWFNAYGPTETTCTSTVYEAGSSEWEGERFVPIGKPVANTRTYVLDRQGNPVAVGIPGELFIGGVGVARGYLNSPELTAQRFLKDPFTADPESRLYRTGDQVFYLPDGNIVFLGRLDRQVKIRGFRVELDEIEAVLAAHPSVRECSVMVQGQESQPRLIAYVSAGGDADPGQLRRHAAAHLPSHMLPAAFVMLDSMPHTSGGKIDRQALPAFEVELLGSDLDSQTPSTATEKLLAALWQQALGLPITDATANFFELGGDSLKAVQLIMLIQEQFGKELSFATLLRAPSIARIAAILDAGVCESDDSAWDAVLPLQPEGWLNPLFCISPIVQGPYSFRALAKHLGVGQPFYVVSVLPKPGDQTPSVEELASRAAKSIRATRQRGPYILGGYCFGGTVAFETARQLRSMGEEVQMLALFDTPAPGYPKLLRGHTRNWRRLREVFVGDGARKIISHLDMTGRLIKRKMVGQTERRLAHFALAASLPAADDFASWQERSIRRYAPKPIDVPIAQFIARDEAISTRILEDPRLAWRELCSGEFHVHRVSGSHGTLLAEPLALDLAGVLSGLLRRVNPEKASAARR